jgi:hypothetical protein
MKFFTIGTNSRKYCLVACPTGYTDTAGECSLAVGARILEYDFNVPVTTYDSTGTKTGATY